MFIVFFALFAVDNRLPLGGQSSAIHVIAFETGKKHIRATIWFLKRLLGSKTLILSKDYHFGFFCPIYTRLKHKLMGKHSSGETFLPEKRSLPRMRIYCGLSRFVVGGCV